MRKNGVTKFERERERQTQKIGGSIHYFAVVWSVEPKPALRRTTEAFDFLVVWLELELQLQMFFLKNEFLNFLFWFFSLKFFKKIEFIFNCCFQRQFYFYCVIHYLNFLNPILLFFKHFFALKNRILFFINFICLFFVTYFLKLNSRRTPPPNLILTKFF